MLRRILETYPPGHPRAGQLRFRTCVVSVGRQNGKTEIGAVLGLWGLFRAPGSITIGLASNKDQADLIYSRARKAVDANPTLAARFKRSTGTRGLETNDGALYRVTAARSAALQGIPITTGLVDELHILPAELWADVVNGTGGRPNTLVIGITTAGSEESELLKSLYETGEKAAAGDPTLERFGFWKWEAPEARVPEDDGTLLEWLKAANPALSSGRLDSDTVLADVRALGNAEIIRYRLNRFVASEDSFISLDKWGDCVSPLGTEWPDGRVTVGVDWTPERTACTFTAAIQDANGVVHTKVIHSAPQPTLEGLVRVAQHFAAWSPVTFAMESYALRDLAEKLRDRGHPVTIYGPGDIVRASNSFYARVQRRTIRHAGDPLLTVQLPGTVRKAVGDTFRISRQRSAEIDAVMATVMAVHAAENAIEKDEIAFAA